MPGNHAAEENEDGDVQSDDVSDTDERGGKVHADVGNRALAHESGGRRSTGPELEPADTEFDDGADARGRGQVPDTLGPALTDFQHLGGRFALRKSQWLLDDERAPQRNRKQHAEQTADAGDGSDPPVIERAPVAQEYERRQGKYRAHGGRLARGCGGLHDVVLEDVRVPEKLENRH